MYSLSHRLSLYYQARHTVAVAKMTHTQSKTANSKFSWQPDLVEYHTILLITLCSKFDRFNNATVMYYFIAERIVCWHVVQVFLNHVIILDKTKTIIINLIILKPGTLKVTMPGSWQLHLFTFCFWQLTFRNTLKVLLLSEVSCYKKRNAHSPLRATSQRPLTVLHCLTLKPLLLKNVMVLLIHLYSNFINFFVVFYYSHYCFLRCFQSRSSLRSWSIFVSSSGSQKIGALGVENEILCPIWYVFMFYWNKEMCYRIVKFCSLACIYYQTAAAAFGLLDILKVFSNIISTLEKNSVSIMKPNSKTVTKKATLIYSVNLLTVELTLKAGFGLHT